MSKRKPTEDLDSLPPVSGPRRRATNPLFSLPPASQAPRKPTQPGLSAPPPQPAASERVLRAAGLGPRPVRAPR
jgi:hypothetical protein